MKKLIFPETVATEIRFVYLTPTTRWRIARIRRNVSFCTVRCRLFIVRSGCAPRRSRGLVPFVAPNDRRGPPRSASCLWRDRNFPARLAPVRFNCERRPRRRAHTCGDGCRNLYRTPRRRSRGISILSSTAPLCIAHKHSKRRHRQVVKHERRRINKSVAQRNVPDGKQSDRHGTSCSKM